MSTLPAPTLPLHIVHFNDVYDVSSRKQEPVGGAALFAAKVAAVTRNVAAAVAAAADPGRLADLESAGRSSSNNTTTTTTTSSSSSSRNAAWSKPLLLFSGDSLSPSMISCVTKGEHMIRVLNHLQVDAACVGNHDLDFGCSHFKNMQGLSKFPWLCTNAHHEVAAEGMQVRVVRVLNLDSLAVQVFCFRVFGRVCSRNFSCLGAVCTVFFSFFFCIDWQWCVNVLFGWHLHALGRMAPWRSS